MRKLRLADWASIAELISAIAVVISLLYVGLQVNENTNEIRAANRQQITNRAHSATMLAATSPELAGAVAKVADGTNLTLVELSIWIFHSRHAQGHGRGVFTSSGRATRRRILENALRDCAGLHVADAGP